MRIKLFDKVYCEAVWVWEEVLDPITGHPDSKITGERNKYYHACTPRGTRTTPMYNYIEESGTCSICNTYIASYKKLDVIASLKNLTS